MNEIALTKLSVSPFQVFDKGWFLLCGGDFGASDWNAMTVSWGFFGTMWNKPVVQVVVRPQRYTREFLDALPEFTLSQFPAALQPALVYCGRVSGRGQADKTQRAGLTAIASQKVAAPSFAEACFTLECRTLFRQPMEKASFLSEALARENYPDGDYHICYIAEVLGAYGAPRMPGEG